MTLLSSPATRPIASRSRLSCWRCSTPSSTRSRARQQRPLPPDVWPFRRRARPKDLGAAVTGIPTGTTVTPRRDVPPPPPEPIQQVASPVAPELSPPTQQAAAAPPPPPPPPPAA